MFYHVSILTKLQEKNKGNPIVKVDITSLSDILNDIIFPYVKNEEFIFEGVPFTKKETAQLVIKESNISAEE